MVTKKDVYSAYKTQSTSVTMLCPKSHVHLSKQYKNVPLCLRYCDYREQWHSLQYRRIWPAGALILIRRAPSWIQTDKGVLRGRGEAKRGDNMVANLLDHELIPRLTCEHTGNARSALLFSFGLNNNTRRSLIIFTGLLGRPWKNVGTVTTCIWN